MSAAPEQKAARAALLRARKKLRDAMAVLLGWNISLELRLRGVEAVINVPLRALTSVPAVLRKLVKP